MCKINTIILVNGMLLIHTCMLGIQTWVRSTLIGSDVRMYNKTIKIGDKTYLQDKQNRQVPYQPIGCGKNKQLDCPACLTWALAYLCEVLDLQ